MAVTERRFTFDQVADLYDAVRPDYPAALAEDVLAAAGLSSGEQLLEIGSGSGKATEIFARRGFPIVAVEPGAELIRAAERRLAGAGNVRFIESTFEAWPAPAGAFGLVFAAQAIHWLPPEARIEKPATALRPGGMLAVFGNVPTPFQGAFGETVNALYRRYAPSISGPPPEAGYLPSGPFGQMIEASGRFGPVEHRAYSWSRTHTAETYPALMSTMSNHILLDAEPRARLLEGLAQAIEAEGGTIDLHYETHLYMARRAPRSIKGRKP
jgi:SAM-dependent methyltransferase